MQESLEEFLTNTKENNNYILGKKKIRLRNVKEDVIATNHVDIMCIFVEEIFENGVELNVKLESPDEEIRDDIFVKIFHDKKITYDWEEFFNIIQNSIKDGYRAALQKLYKKYFDYCITAYLENNRALLSKCGWVHDEYIEAFLPFTLPHKFLKDDFLSIQKDLFNGYFRKQSEIADIQELYTENSNLRKLFSILLKDSCAFTVFSYSIHTILWDYFHGYNCRELQTEEIANQDCIFSLCIYGKDPSASKILANLLANFFNIDRNKWATIQRKYHVSSSSVSQIKFDRLFLYKSVPIIITSRTNHLTKASSIVKKLHQKRENLMFHCYPVYISSSPILVDEMINCCSDSMANELRSMKYDDLHAIHQQFCYLLYQFITYLSIDKNNTDDDSRNMHLNQDDKQYMETSLFRLLERQEFTEEWLDTHMPNIYLCSTMDCFCQYLDRTPLNEYADRLRTFSEACFLSGEQVEKQECCLKQVRQEKKNIYFLCELISKNLQPKNESWLWEGKEKRGEKEECYYLELQKGYEVFTKILEKNSIFPISKNEFKEMLRTYHILKMPASGKSNTMKRRNIYVLVLLKNRLDAFRQEEEEKGH